MPKPAVKSVVVRFRAYPKELAAWKQNSLADALTLSKWIRRRLNSDQKTLPAQAIDQDT